MYLSSKDWQAFINTLSKINTVAAKAMAKYIHMNGYGNNDELIKYAYEIAEYYGTASGAVAAEMYDAIAALEGVAVPAAQVAALPTYGDVAKAVNGTLKQTLNAEMLSSTVSRLVKQVGQDTLVQNGARDGAEFAWIPHGDTCAYCIGLAANGWVKISKRSMRKGHAEHIHSNCDCSYMVRHTSDTEVQGYNPDKYWDMLEKAAVDQDIDELGGSTSLEYARWMNMNPDVINALRRENYAKNKDKINAQKRSAYEKRQELNSSEAEEINVD